MPVSALDTNHPLQGLQYVAAPPCSMTFAAPIVAPTAGATGGPTRVDIRNNSVRFFHLDESAEDCSIAPIPFTSSQRRSLRQALTGISPAGPGGTCLGIGIYQGAGMTDSPIPGASTDP